MFHISVILEFNLILLYICVETGFNCLFRNHCVIIIVEDALFFEEVSRDSY